MIGRENYDRLLPDCYRTREMVGDITGLDMSFDCKSDNDIVVDGLAWLAEFTESDRFIIIKNEYPWRRDPNSPDWSPGEPLWPIHMRGLEYKDNSSYLTAEGWPLSTTCWYVLVEAGYREYCCAETMHLAVLRGIVITKLFMLDRETPPKKRLHPVDLLAAMVGGCRKLTP